jgi:indole-3-glycerol phosphate synthase
MSKPTFIAEVKTQSPFGFKSNKTWFELFDIANEYGDMISVHTNSLWGGNFDLLALAKRRTKKPILAKGLHLSKDEIKKCIDYGADYILCYDYIPDFSSSELYARTLLIEPKNEKTLDDFVKNSRHPFYVINQRDILTGRLSDMSFDIIRNKYPDKYLCQASFIKTINDVHPNANAFIVGTHLETFVSTL